MNYKSVAIFGQHGPLWNWWWGQWGPPSLIAMTLQFPVQKNYFENTLFNPGVDVRKVAEVYLLRRPVGSCVIWIAMLFTYTIKRTDLEGVKFRAEPQNKSDCKKSNEETWAASGSTPWGRPLPLARAAKLLEATLPEKKENGQSWNNKWILNMWLTSETGSCLSRTNNRHRDGVLAWFSPHIFGRVLQAEGRYNSMMTVNIV